MTTIEDNFRKNHLIWFENVTRRQVSAPVRKSESIDMRMTRKVKGRHLTTSNTKRHKDVYYNI